MKEFINETLAELQLAENISVCIKGLSVYGHVWTEKKMEFFHKFCKGKLTSTVFGAEFFTKVKELLEMTPKEVKKQLADKNGNLGEYDQNLFEILKPYLKQ